jgi:hypothetical protein
MAHQKYLIAVLFLLLLSPVCRTMRQEVMTVPQACAAGIGDGVNNINGLPTNTNLRGSAKNILKEVLTYVNLIAVIAIVVAGIYLIVGGGSENSVGRARKIIIFTIVGIALITFASGLVKFVVDTLT